MTNFQRKGVQMAALGLVAALALGLAAAPAFAGGRAERVNGMQVAIDANGKLRQPTAAESRALAAPFMNKAAAGDAQFTAWADGTLSMVLTADYLNVWLVGLNADGSANQVCVDGFNAATVQPAPALEEK
ncbi:MAG TPA: hypothetical protein VHC97_14225 [Thermoanaerobaculia bacterium]|jgi:hypothetical protein|nr:hypothetical protein [Thermoanaerobaculia bacterium]